MRPVAIAALAPLIAVLLPASAHAQMIASFTSNAGDLSNVTAAAGTSQLSLEGTYIDHSIQMSQFVQSAQYSASTLVATCPPSSCSPLVGLPMAGSGQNADQAFQSIINRSQDGMINGVLQAYAAQGYKNICALSVSYW